MCLSATAVLLNGAEVAGCMSSKLATRYATESVASLLAVAFSFGNRIAVCISSDSATAKVWTSAVLLVSNLSKIFGVLVSGYLAAIA